MEKPLKTKEISFCDKLANNVVNIENKSLILDKLSKYGISFNGRSAVIVNNIILNNLVNNPHLIGLKSSGTNYLLFLTKINDINYCFYIDRKLKQGYSYPRIISTKYRFDDTIFRDTLLEGELVRDHSNNWSFLIGDLLCYKGEKEVSNISIRFNKIYNMLSKFYIRDDTLEICPLIVKRLFMYNDIDYIKDEFIENLPYSCRGLYFYTLNTKHSNYLYLFQSGFKIKCKSESNEEIINNSNTTNSNTTNSNTTNSNTTNSNTTNSITTIKSKYIILGIMKTINPEIYNVYCNKSGELYTYGIAHIGSLRKSKLILSIFEDLGLNEVVNMECEYSEKFKKWEPIKISNKDIISFEDLN
jgi:hypothetical protein